MPDQDNTLTPLQELTKAVQKFVTDRTGEPRLLRGAVVCWEAVTFDDEDGKLMYNVNYASCDDTSMGETIGILTLAKSIAMSDMLGDDDD